MEKIIVKTIENDEKYLRQISKKVDFNDKSYLGDIKKLEEYCINDSNIHALAAVQIGIPKRIIYIKNTDLNQIGNEEYNEARILINPKIIKQTGRTLYWEACASCLDNMGLVERPYKIEIEYYDKDSNVHREIFEGFESTVLYHEYDHLDGILHIDIAKEILHMNREERKEFRKTHKYEIRDKKGEYKRGI